MCTIVVKKQLFEALQIGQLTQAELDAMVDGLGDVLRDAGEFMGLG